ncbi:hypothetical protein CEXT_354671 [Caerostris extrusa]|uniref:Uncharacterized protein n=1 Tax=Caerostris extrusa TaxID=172846 RepID=A0AAV4N4T4_CAEEX|nr:hypothetical protein CEXT_354671 [Caerostris extrusa]
MTLFVFYDLEGTDISQFEHLSDLSFMSWRGNFNRLCYGIDLVREMSGFFLLQKETKKAAGHPPTPLATGRCPLVRQPRRSLLDLASVIGTDSPSFSRSPLPLNGFNCPVQLCPIWLFDFAVSAAITGLG